MSNNLPSRATVFGAPTAKVAHEMTTEEFARMAIAIEVHPQMRGGRMGLTPADKQANLSLARFRDELIGLLPGAHAPEQQADKVIDTLMAQSFRDDVWYSSIRGLPPLVLVKRNSIEGFMSLPEVLARAHSAQVIDAMKKGQEIPDRVVNDYRRQYERRDSQAAKTGGATAEHVGQS